jgi:2-keto-4-pentenoate hydratase
MNLSASSMAAVLAVIHARQQARVVSAPDDLFGHSLAQGYDLQASLIELNSSCNNRVSGWKAAMSNRPALERFGLSEPVYGVLLDDMLLPTEQLSAGRTIAPKIEIEIAFQLNRDLTDPATSDVQILNAIERMAPAIEIADCRLPGWSFDISAFLADHAAASFFRVGDYISLQGFDSSRFQCQLRYGDNCIDGHIKALLDGPLGSCVRMVRHVLRHHGVVRQSDHLLSGSLIKPLDMVAGNRYELDMFGQTLTLIYED